MISIRSLRGKLFLCVLFMLALLVPSVLAMPAAQETPPCVGDSDCYEDPPPTIPENEPSVAHNSWEGFSDGRLNPDMTEYYSVWCENNLVRVLRSSPSPETVVEISLGFVIQMGDGIPLYASNNVVLTRSGDMITLSGSNGNLAPQPGNKTFSLSQCIERSGSAPASIPEDDDSYSSSDFTSDQTCEDQMYFETHQTECASCEVSHYRRENSFECMPIVEKLFEIGYGVCMNPVAPVGSVISFAFLRRRRKRNM